MGVCYITRDSATCTLPPHARELWDTIPPTPPYRAVQLYTPTPTPSEPVFTLHNQAIYVIVRKVNSTKQVGQKNTRSSKMFSDATLRLWLQGWKEWTKVLEPLTVKFFSPYELTSITLILNRFFQTFQVQHGMSWACWGEKRIYTVNFNSTSKSFSILHITYLKGLQYYEEAYPAKTRSPEWQ